MDENATYKMNTRMELHQNKHHFNRAARKKLQTNLRLFVISSELLQDKFNYFFSLIREILS